MNASLRAGWEGGERGTAAVNALGQLDIGTLCFGGEGPEAKQIAYVECSIILSCFETNSTQPLSH